jgi:hypothetical protein
VRNSVIGVGRKNQADAAIAVPQLRAAASASISAVSRLATAPPCKPATGPAASAEGCQWWGAVKGSKIAKETAKADIPEVKDIECWENLADDSAYRKRDFIT